jgi:hypothetical protein
MRRKRRSLIQLAVTLAASAATCGAQVVPDEASSAQTRIKLDSVMVFGGLLSTTDFTSTLLLNQNYTPRSGIGKEAFDNYIAGVDYERNVLELAHDLRLRVEIGVDDRFGHYAVCCLIPKPHDPRYASYGDLTVWHSSLIHSAELRVGGKVRWENFRLGGARFEIAGTAGLSAVTRTLGRERQREIEYRANAHLLGFVAPELGVSLDREPGLELVVRVLHRSGAGGTFGGMREGYNADVVGVRYAF